MQLKEPHECEGCGFDSWDKKSTGGLWLCPYCVALPYLNDETRVVARMNNLLERRLKQHMAGLFKDLREVVRDNNNV